MARKRHVKRFRRESEKAELLLKKVARELDKCGSLGIKMNHGIIMSRFGYILPGKKHKWVVRMLIDGYRLDDDDED
jgi:hypothetical protein